MNKIAVVFAVFLWFASGFVRVAHPAVRDTVRTDSVIGNREGEAKRIAGKLISPCCWKQTVDVHPSSASDKINAEIREALDQGQTEEQIIDRFVAKYGERILAVPKPSGFNLMLWIIPASVLLIGSLALAMFLRFVSNSKKDRGEEKQQNIPDSELERVERELKEMDS